MNLPTRGLWIHSPAHTRWLRSHTRAQLDYYRAAVDDDRGGFFWIGLDGSARPDLGKQLWLNPRFVYAYTLGDLLGDPTCAAIVREGLDYLENGPLHDRENGGWYWSLGVKGEDTRTKEAYGHAFVLLAAATAVSAGFDAGRLLDSALDVLIGRFWDERHGMFVDSWDREFRTIDPYRGQNANMHLTEALMAAHEATGDESLLDKAVRIAERLIRDEAAAHDWRVPEAFDENWEVDRSGPPSGGGFRGWASLPGHGFEWARLVLQLNHAVAERLDWAPEASRRLFARAIRDGWDDSIGGVRTLIDLDGTPLFFDRFHWSVAEGIGAAASLYRQSGEAEYALWYQRFWEFAGAHLIDPADGSWHHQLDATNHRTSTAWDGRPDLYHSLQASLIPLNADAGSIASNLLRAQAGCHAPA